MELKKLRIPISLFFLSFILDRVTKWLALSFLSGATKQVCYGFNLVLVWNRGVSWSLFWAETTTAYWILVAFIMFAIIALSAYVLWRFINNFSINWEMLVLGGAISNLIDRLWYGAVIDFIDIYVSVYHWPVFNIADAAIVIGIGGIFIRTWWYNE